MDFQDIELKCVDCGDGFPVTGGEQEFFKAKGFDLPKRCKSCRDKKKNRQSSPFGKIADEMSHGKDFGNRKRHGRERRNDWEGGNR